ncbi:glycoside hydrolase family 51 protein [Coniophora puteana RWD-64-598 SS2]|uniref:non-reducing end alpha-L-arabinofuranosidase n=1 Tax=Coniophora puteana (strain RWD-64-598) TaxID=741705 RepID=A0A5M3N4Q7_CONPW|nr:glycoside hydrolase family 51 protein [Coniophora puteana RWD-64-598 SS2]EIW86286.1 glycoside hydrolase family 51 protein [Coniophora puteana RWD-64-598 SS2]
MLQGRVGRAAALLGAATAALAATTVVVNGTASHAIPSTLYGQMFEDINGGDGGLYAELLQNRAFQQVTPGDATALYAWAAVNGGNITVIADSDPVSSALPNSLQLTIPSGASGSVGFGNEGYYGINVNSSWTYNASFYYRFPEASDFSGDATVALQSASGEVYASAQIPISGSQTTWTQVYAQLTPSTSPSSTANNFTVTFNSSAAGNTINFAMFSLFPPTFKNRANGMRIDVAEARYIALLTLQILLMRPSFFRLPGGNNLEGQSAATRWIWNNTVGALVDRPGRVGDWGYINTDGLGLLEYLYWCEDMEMEPFMAVWAGYSLDGTSLPEDELAPYIQAAIDQINFVIGDPSDSSAAALRASLGREEPFSLTYVEVGNEDFFASESYIYRWRDFAGNLTAAFPQLKFIATAYPFNPILDPTPQQYDNHVYQTPDWFAENSFYYDDFERNGTYYFQGEYAVTSTNASDLYGTTADGRLMYPTIQGSIGEAAYMTGFERNADIVFAASYAPLLMNVADGAYQWTPNLVEFDAANAYKSTSFYVQQLFSLNRGTEYLPSTLPDPSGTVFWSVTSDSSTLAIKLVNYANTTEDVTFQLPFAVSSSATVTVLTGDPTASNTPTNPNLVTPTTTAVTIAQAFNYTAPAYSLSVLNIELS